MMETDRILVYGQNADPVGQAPAVVLETPKYSRNVAMVVRNVGALLGMGQVWFTGNRIWADINGRKRLPREERMKHYLDSVQLIQYDYPLDAFDDAVPVVVEVDAHAHSLYNGFIHPERAVYIFGPEDGSVSAGFRHLAHHVVSIPSYHCLNLAVAVALVLGHRIEQRKYVDPLPDVNEMEMRGFIDTVTV